MQRKIFKLESSLYSRDLILQAIEDFWADFQIWYAQNGALEIGGDTDAEIEEVFQEFMNYVIGLHNELV